MVVVRKTDEHRLMEGVLKGCEVQVVFTKRVVDIRNSLAAEMLVLETASKFEILR